MIRAIFSIFFSAVLPLAAQNVFELQFVGEAASDAVSGRPVELHNVVVMGSGAASYGDLDGKGAIVVPADPELSFSSGSTFWVELWINPVNFGKTGVIITKGTGGNYRISAQAKGLFALSFYSQGAWRSLQSEVPLALGEWQHVACLFDSSAGVATLFLNGKVAGHTAGLPTFQSKDENPLMIGGNPLKEGGEYVGMTGSIGRVTIARESPHGAPVDPVVGQQAFEVKSPF